MSTFTQWNGPQGASGASTKDITGLIDAYNSLSTLLNNHIDEKASGTGSTVHDIRSYVEDKLTTLSNSINAVIATLTTKDYTDSTFATKTTLNSYVQSSTLEDYASKDALNEYLKTSIYNTKIASLDSVISELQTAVTDFNDTAARAKAVISSDLKNVAAETITATACLIGILHAKQYIDFTTWKQFTAQFAGTGSFDTTGTNGIYILGQLSEDWDIDAPDDNYKPKAARAYVKYVNSKPFDAIIDMTATGMMSGSLTANVSMGDSPWSNMKFHLLHGTDSSGKQHIYLGVSADGLSTQSLEVRVAGVNFIPGNTLNAVTTELTHVTVGNGFCASGVLLDSIATDTITDSQGKPILTVTYTTDPLGQTKKELYIGDESFDSFKFDRRFKVFIKKKGQEVGRYSSVLTAADLTSFAGIDVGVTVQWPLYEVHGTDENDNDVVFTSTEWESMSDDDKAEYLITGSPAINVPYGWLPCDGSEVNTADYEELAELLGHSEDSTFKLPMQDFSMIHAVSITNQIDITDTDSADDEIKTLAAMSEAINVLNKSVTKHTSMLNKIVSFAYPSEDDLPTHTPTSEGNIILNGTPVLVTDTDNDTVKIFVANVNDNGDIEWVESSVVAPKVAARLIFSDVSQLPTVTPDDTGANIESGLVVLVINGSDTKAYRATVSATNDVTWTDVTTTAVPLMYTTISDLPSVTPSGGKTVYNNMLALVVTASSVKMYKATVNADYTVTWNEEID